MDIAALTALIEQHKWVPLAALLIGLVVRLLKSDTKIPIDIPPRWRIWLAFALGAVSGVLQAITTGTPWRAALAGGLASTTLAVLGQNVVVDSLRGGKEFVIPGLIKPDVAPSPGKPVSLKPPPNDKGGPPSIPPAVVVMFCILLAGCGLFAKALDLAADKAKCVVDNQELPDKVIFVKCAISDPEKYLELLAESRAATKRALERQAVAFVSDRSDAGTDASFDAAKDAAHDGAK